MGQIFHRSANVVAQVSLLGAFVIAPGAIFGFAIGVSHSPYNTKVGVPLDQPAPFSHEHHVTELGIDCRYCHTNVEKSNYSSVPPTQTCMSCHSQIWTNSPLLEPVRESYRTNTPLVWNQLNKVPEFVYFNHSIHINRGINCNNCHGPVEKMMLTYKGQPFRMSWCLECHRNPGKYIYKDKDSTKSDETPRQQVFDIYWKYQAGTPLTARERSLMDGVPYTPTPAEQAEGDALVEKYHVKKKQLADCWICHR